MFILDFLGIGESIGTAWFTFTIWLAQGLYSLAAGAFEIFLLLADGSILKSIDYGVVLNNFYLLISIIMLFIVAFNLLKGMIDPDDKKYGTASVKKIIINTVTSFIIMAVLPTIFTFAFDFQTAMVNDYNPLGSFFGYGDLSGTSSSTAADNISSSANQIVSSVFTAFLNVNCDGKDCSTGQKLQDEQNNVKLEDETSFFDAIGEVNSTGKFSIFSSFGGKVYNDEMTFDFLLAIVAGGILIYIAVSYCFDMALRLIKLIFYQLIAPIPIFFRIVPDGKLSGTFGEWVKVTLACYLEVFVRLFVFYFVIFLCQSVIASDILNTLTAGRGYFISLFTKAFVLMGLVTFMKAAPGLISKVTGIDSGNMKLGIKEKLAAGGGFAAGAVLGGAGISAIRNGISGGANIKNKWSETKGFKGKAGLIAGALGSTVAGFTSGGYNAAKSGGGKSWADMTKAANSGAKKSSDNKVKRADNIKRYKADGRNWVTGHIHDFGEDLSDYFVGGADKYNGIIKTSSDINASYDNMEAQATKIYEKFKNSSTIKPTEFKFKGSDKERAAYQAIAEKYQDFSMAAMEAELTRLQNTNPETLVDRNAFVKKTRIAPGKFQETFDESAYNVAVEEARRNHTLEVANMSSALNQMKKQTIENIMQQAITHTENKTDWEGISLTDMLGVHTAAAEFRDKFSAAGNYVQDEITGTFSQQLDLTANNIQKQMDDINKAYKNVGNKAKSESAAARRKAEQRKNNSN